ncbi:hypothetical protein KKC87_00990 [Patescibacteria group bacterium]|nr:hypothetical protein [Patescibacteria group bacterium]
MAKLIYPSLFMLGSGHEAKWYKVLEENSAELLAEQTTPKTNYSDKEGPLKMGKDGSFRIGGTDLKSKDRENEQEENMKKMIDQTLHLWKENGYEYFCFALPARFKNEFNEAVENVIGKEKMKYKEGEFLYFEDNQMPELFKECLLPKE